jgi:hypothetical protein
MSAHTLNTSTYTIRTESDVLATVVGISTALTAVQELETRQSVAVFKDDEFLMSASHFSIWAKRMNRLLNEGIGWDGKATA